MVATIAVSSSHQQYSWITPVVMVGLKKTAHFARYVRGIFANKEKNVDE
jgi:hypothetical protein